MPKQRDGPAPGRPARGPGVDERDARLLPRSESPRNSRARPTSPKIRVRRRQPKGWRTFDVRVCLPPTSDAVHAMHVYLRTMARRFGLEIADIDEVREPPKSND